MKCPSEETKMQASSIITASVMGFHFISGMIVGVFLGYAIDQYFNSYPWGVGFGFLFGVISGFYSVWIDTKKLLREK